MNVVRINLYIIQYDINFSSVPSSKWCISPASRGGNLAKLFPNQDIVDFGRGSSVESE